MGEEKMNEPSVAQIRAFRLRAHHLDRTYAYEDIPEAVGACGMQNTPPGAWENALYHRIPSCSLVQMERLLYGSPTDSETGKALLQAWSLRGAPFVFPASESGIFLSALIPQAEEPWIYTRGIALAREYLGMEMEPLLELLKQVILRLDNVVITGKNVLTRLEKSGKLLSEIKRHLEKDGKLLLLETIPKKSTRLSELTDGEISAELKEAEERIYSDNPLSRWDETDLENLIASHFESVSIRIEKSMEKRYLSKESVRSWWERSYSKFVDEKFKDAFISSLADREVDWRSEIAVIKGTNSDLKKKKTPSQDEWKRVHQITKENS